MNKDSSFWLRICGIEGWSEYDWECTVQLFAGELELFELQRCRRDYNEHPLSGIECVWNDKVVWPLRISELLRDSCVYFELIARKTGQDLTLDVTTERFQAFAALFDEQNSLLPQRTSLRLWPCTQNKNDFIKSFSSDKSWRLQDTTAQINLVQNNIGAQNYKADWLDRLAFAAWAKKRTKELASSKLLALVIELPQLDIGNTAMLHQKPKISQELKISNDLNCLRNFTKIHDAHMFSENLVEAKHRLLFRYARNIEYDKAIKPDPVFRDIFDQLLRKPWVYELTLKEKDLIWHYRYYLARYRWALSKFLLSVDWQDPIQVDQAEKLLPIWTEIEVEDALEILGPKYTNRNVRNFAVLRLYKAKIDKVALYLLQLIQALCFEPDIIEALEKKTTNQAGSLGLPDTKPDNSGSNIEKSNLLTDFIIAKFEKSAILMYLIDTALKDQSFFNDLYWFLKVECEDSTEKNTFLLVQSYVLKRLAKNKYGLMIKRQSQLVSIISQLSRSIKISKESRPKKAVWLREKLSKECAHIGKIKLRIPLDSRVVVQGINASSSSIFKSSQSPLLIDFTTLQNNYPVIFKSGDDLRQDQFVLQIISLVDRLLKEQNLDLRLTIYRVLPLGPNEGFVQYIPSSTLSEALFLSNGSMKNYLLQLSSSEDSISTDIMENYVRSCAGYCIITYLLGIGDRHSENIMIRPQGSIFHIDFGYILGRDPKPFAPLMKVSWELIEGMKGRDSVEFSNFQTYCVTAFIILRKRVNIILSLFALMQCSSIKDIRYQAESSVNKLISRFCLNLNDEEASEYIQNLISESLKSIVPQLMNRAHSIAQYFRS